MVDQQYTVTLDEAHDLFTTLLSTSCSTANEQKTCIKIYTSLFKYFTFHDNINSNLLTPNQLIDLYGLNSSSSFSLPFKEKYTENTLTQRDEKLLTTTISKQNNLVNKMIIDKNLLEWFHFQLDNNHDLIPQNDDETIKLKLSKPVIECIQKMQQYIEFIDVDLKIPRNNMYYLNAANILKFRGYTYEEFMERLQFKETTAATNAILKKITKYLD